MKKIILLIFMFSNCFASDVKISGLPLGSAFNSGVNDVFPYVDATQNITKKMRISDLSNLPAFVGIGSYYSFGSFSSPNAIAASSGITASSNSFQIIYTSSTSGVTLITAIPQVSAGIKLGQVLRLVGTSDTNAITLSDGNGLYLNGLIILGTNVTIDLHWNGLVWSETNRSN